MCWTYWWAICHNGLLSLLTLLGAHRNDLRNRRQELHAETDAKP